MFGVTEREGGWTLIHLHFYRLLSLSEERNMDIFSRKTSPHAKFHSDSELHGPLQFKNWFMLSVRLSSYGCTREVGRAREKRKSCTRRSRLAS